MTPLLSKNKNLAHACALSRYWLCFNVGGESKEEKGKVSSPLSGKSMNYIFLLEMVWGSLLPSLPGCCCHLPSVLCETAQQSASCSSSIHLEITSSHVSLDTHELHPNKIKHWLMANTV